VDGTSISTTATEALDTGGYNALGIQIRFKATDLSAIQNSPSIVRIFSSLVKTADQAVMLRV
jgi:hypothetical protein